MHDHAFIIRCWDEADVSNASNPKDIISKEHVAASVLRLWRYRVIHANTGQELAVDTLSEITNFITGILEHDA